MAVQYKAGGNRFSRSIFKVLKVLVVIGIIAALVPLATYIISLFGIEAPYYAVDSFYNSIQVAVSSALTRIGAFLQQSGLAQYISYYAKPLFATFFLLLFFYKLIFKGYWKLIMRPYMVVTTILGLAVFYLITSNLNLEAAFASLFYSTAVFTAPLLDMAGEDTALLVYTKATDFHAHYIFVYYIIMFFFSRFTVWMNFSSRMEYILPSDALDDCRSVLKEGRKKAWGMPLRVKFYLARDNSFNAFAFAHNKVAINSGTMEQADRELLRGVIAHELGHIAHLDVTANTIAQANFYFIFSLITIPAGFVSGFAPKEGERVNIFAYIIWTVFFTLMRIVQSIMHGIHYVCYLLGGKRCEYKADKFAVKIGEGKGLLRFMAAFVDAPSGGFKDPHPSTRNRLDHILSWIDGSRREEYENLDTKAIRSSLL